MLKSLLKTKRGIAALTLMVFGFTGAFLIAYAGVVGPDGFISPKDGLSDVVTRLLGIVFLTLVAGSGLIIQAIYALKPRGKITTAFHFLFFFLWALILFLVGMGSFFGPVASSGSERELILWVCYLLCFFSFVLALLHYIINIPAMIKNRHNENWIVDFWLLLSLFILFIYFWLFR